MASPHPYSRVVFRQRLRAWLGRNRRIFAGASGVTVLAVLGLWLLWSFAMPESWAAGWMLGMLQATVVAALIHVLYALFIAHDPQAVWHVRGAWGEDNTRSELERAKRKGLVWGWVDSVPLQHGDIDHLVVPRRGSLIAIDSKWRSNSTDVAEMTQGAQRMRVRAEALTRDQFSATHQSKPA